MSYQQKYLKYKTKYKNLCKHKNILRGGINIDALKVQLKDPTLLKHKSNTVYVKVSIKPTLQQDFTVITQLSNHVTHVTGQLTDIYTKGIAYIEITNPQFMQNDKIVAHKDKIQIKLHFIELIALPEPAPTLPAPTLPAPPIIIPAPILPVPTLPVPPLIIPAQPPQPPTDVVSGRLSQNIYKIPEAQGPISQRQMPADLKVFLTKCLEKNIIITFNTDNTESSLSKVALKPQHAYYKSNTLICVLNSIDTDSFKITVTIKIADIPKWDIPPTYFDISILSFMPTFNPQVIFSIQEIKQIELIE